MIIQNNIPALNSGRAFDTNSSKLSKSLEKLSSGYSVNRAADDSAGLAVSEKMRSQILGIRQSVRNTQDGVSLIQTFEGALNETVSIIKRAKSLAVQSANGSYDDGIDRSAIEIEYLHLCDEVTHIAGTDFNGIVMLSDREIASKLAEIEKKIDILTGSLSKHLSAVTNGPAGSPQAISAKSAAPKAGGVICGDFTVYGDSSDFSFDNASGVLTISGGDVTVEGTGKATANSIAVQKDKDANVTLKNVNIIASNSAAFTIADDSTGNVNVILEGNNSLKSNSSNHAGLEKNCTSLADSGNYGTLTISGNGSLTAGSQSSSGAGIGGGSQFNSCNIVIESGTVTADGRDSAGIGGGNNASGKNIVINGGNITASSHFDAGIGGGVFGNGIDITVNGGTVKATGGGDGGAGIGGGKYGYAQNITVNGGTVIASSNSYGAGIGGGGYKSAQNIIINGGTVIAKGGNSPSSNSSTAIGSGGESSSGSTVTINGGTVTAIGGSSETSGAAGIGGDGSTVNINGIDTVVMAKGGKNAEDIGSSSGQSNSTVTIGEDLISEPFTGNGITDGTIVHNKNNANPAHPSDPDDPKPGDPGSPAVSVSDAFNNASAKLTYTDNLILQVGPRSKDAVNFTFKYPGRGIGGLNADLNCTAKGLGMDKLTLKTQKSANYAVDQLDYALNKVTKIRTVFGAAQNRLEHKIDNLNNILENLTSAESGIRDTDMAEEMMNFTKNQIVSQASQSTLAQANSLPQQVLNLIGQ